MTQERLSLIEPALATQLASGIAEPQLRRSCSTFLLPLLERTGLSLNPAVQRAYDILAAGGSDEASHREMQHLAEILDERYFEISQSAEEGSRSDGDVLAAFAQARAAGAVAAALGPDPVFSAQEAAYEAHCAFADGSGVLNVLAEAME